MPSPQIKRKEVSPLQIKTKEMLSPDSIYSHSHGDDIETSHTALLDIEANGNKLSGFAQFHTGNSTNSKTNNWQCLPQKSRSYVIPCIVFAILLLVVAPFATIITMIRVMVCDEGKGSTASATPTAVSQKPFTLGNFVLERNVHDPLRLAEADLMTQNCSVLDWYFLILRYGFEDTRELHDLQVSFRMINYQFAD